MRHLKYLTSKMSQQKIAGVTFHFDSSHQGELVTLIEGFFAAPDQHATLDIPEETRGVFLLEGQSKWVLKHNRLTHWKKQLTNFLGLKRVFGLHDLTNEFINLSTVADKSEFTPRVAAFGYKGQFPFLKDEYLLVGFYENHCSVDDRLRSHPEQAETLLLEVFKLFGQMLAEGFVHMDPHPKNILIAPDGRLRLIDFECCAHSVIDHGFSLGFLLGYFYYFWCHKFIAREDYDNCCERYLEQEHPDLNRAVFQPVYHRFQDRKVSRTTRYSALTCPKAQAELIQELKRSDLERDS